MVNKFNVLIREALVFDGTGSEPYYADIGIKGDKIKLIGVPQFLEGDMQINAYGLAVCPGFI